MMRMSKSSHEASAFFSSPPADEALPTLSSRRGDESDWQPKSLKSRASCLEGLGLFFEDHTLALSQRHDAIMLCRTPKISP
jgi:hypothetical protein